MTALKPKRTPYDIALWAALPMAHTPRIEGRLKMILNTETRRTLPRRTAAFSLALATALLLPLAAVRPVPADSTAMKSVAAPGVKRAALTPEAAWTRMSAKDKAAERRLNQAEAADPENSKWPGELGFLYFLHVADDGTPASRAWARASLTQYDRAVMLVELSMVRTRHVPPTSGPPVSEKIAWMAFAAGDYGRARQCASALLEIGQTPGLSGQEGNLNTANMVLGRLALRDGDIAQAGKHLLAMGRTSGSPTLDTSGPNMRLAKDLLAAGRRDTVLAYLDECGNFWKDPQLVQWRSDVAQGRTPHFGANLYY